MATSSVIRKIKPPVPGLDFSLLRREGIERIIALGSDLWTDFNVHDPGITFLEVLCYAINDLSYRASLPAEDIFASRSGAFPPAGVPLADQVLSSNPVTALDWRKLLIDIDGIRNAWVERATDVAPAFIITDEEVPKIAFQEADALDLNGLLKITLDYDDKLTYNETERDRVYQKVAAKLHAYRNLCEDIAEIKVVPEAGIILCTNVEISEDADPDQVYATILYQVQNFLTPAPSFFGLEEMLERKGTRSFDEIFDGPRLVNGFLDEQDLINSELQERINVSDLYQTVSKIEGVNRVWGLKIRRDPDAEPVESFVTLTDEKPVLEIESSSIQLFRRNTEVFVNEELATDFLEKLKTIYASGSAKDRMEIEYPDAVFHPELGKYFSIQNDLPHTYHVDERGIENSEPAERQAKMRQLKGFLVFFDQILANYLAHLSKVGSLFKTDHSLTSDNKPDPTLFALTLEGAVPDLEDVLVGYDPETRKSELYDAFLKNGLETSENQLRQKDALLSHMLARFGELFPAVALTHFFDDPRTGWSKEDYAYPIPRNISEKSAFLLDVNTLATERGKGFNYKKLTTSGKPDVWDTSNVEGLKKRVCRLLGISDYNRRTLTCEQQYEIEERTRESKYSFLLKNKKAKSILLESFEHNTAQKSKLAQSTLQRALGNMENYQLILDLPDDDTTPFENKSPDFAIQQEKNGSFRLVVTDNNKKKIARSYPAFKSHKELKSFLEDLKGLYINEECKPDGFHIVEHILLRPRFEKCCDNHPALVLKGGCKVEDPYSFWITVVVHATWKKFAHKANRTIFEQTVRSETPAHIGVRICWLTNENMYDFESAYGRWLTELTIALPDRCALDEYAKRLTEVLNRLECTSCNTTPLTPPDLTCK